MFKGWTSGRRTSGRTALVVLVLVAAITTGAPVATAAPGDLLDAALNLHADNNSADGIWSDGTTMWVTDLVDDKIYAYTLDTGARDADKEIDSLAAGNTGPAGLWSDGTTMWVSDWYDGRVYAYTLATGARDADRELSSSYLRNPTGLWSDGTTMWVVSWWHQKALAFHLATGARAADSDILLWPTGNGSSHGMWSDGTVMWVADNWDAKVYAYGLASGAPAPDHDIDTLAAAGNTGPAGLWSDGATIWVLDPDDDKIYGYDLPTMGGLRSLQADGVHIDFAVEQTAYAARAPTTLATITVTAAAMESTATVAITPADADANTDGHQVNLAPGANTVTVTVTDNDATKVYTVVITRVDAATLSKSASLSALTLSDIDLPDLEAFTIDSRTMQAAHYRHSIIVASGTSETTVTATPADEHAVLTIAPADADVDTDGHQVELPTGETTITVALESADGTYHATYGVTLNRPSTAAFGWDATKDFTPLAAAGNSDPRGVWSDGTTVWVVDNEDLKVYAYDFVTGARAPESDFGTWTPDDNTQPRGAWSDGTTMWVADRTSTISTDRVYAYELATGTRAPDSGFQAEPDEEIVHIFGDRSQPTGVWSDGTTMWVADNHADKLYAYSLATGNRTAAADVSTLVAAGNNHAGGLWSDGITIWVVDDGDDKIFAYGLATGERRAGLEFNTLAAAGNHSPSGIWSDGTTMWVSDYRDGKLYAYNMPASAALASLGLDGIDLGFSMARFNYAVSVLAATDTVTITAEAVFPDTAITVSPADADAGTGGHQVTLSPGTDTTITVTATNGSDTRTYTVVVTRHALAMLRVSSVEIKDYDADTNTYKAVVPTATAMATVTAVPVAADATVVYAPEDADNSTEGHQVDLDSTEEMTITVEPADEGDPVLYAVVLQRAEPTCDAVWCGSLDAVAFVGTWSQFAGYMPNDLYAGSSLEPAVFSLDGEVYSVTALVNDRESGILALGLAPTPSADEVASLTLHVGEIELPFGAAQPFSTTRATGFVWTDASLLGENGSPVSAGSVTDVRITSDPAVGNDGNADSDPDETPDGGADADVDSDAAPAAPLTAKFVSDSAPEAHSGGGVFTVRVLFSEPIATSFRVLRDQVLQVQNGTATKFRRVDGRSDLWEIHVEPADAGADVTLTITSATDCASPPAACTSDGKALTNTLTLIVPSTPTDD